MDYKVKPERIDGKVVKTRVFCQDGSELVFIRSDEGEIIRDQSMGKYWINDSDYAKIYRQVCAIFNPSQAAIKDYKKLISQRSTPEEKMMIEAQKIHQKVGLYQQKTTKSWTEASQEIIRSMNNPPIGWRYGTIQERHWLDSFNKAGIKILTQGWLEIKRWHNGEIIWQKIYGLNSAIRMQDHILDQYQLGRDSELSQLESIESVLYRANQLLTAWIRATDKEKQNLQKKLAQVVLQLENCRNEFKIQARDQIEKTISFRDSLNRLNPAAMASRTIIALGKLAKRFDELRAIMPIIALRKQLLIFEKRRLGQVTSQTARAILRISRHPAFVGEPMVEYERKIIRAEINRCIDLLASAWLSPYWEQAGQARYYLTEAKKLVTYRRFLPAKPMFTTACQILTSDLSHLG